MRSLLTVSPLSLILPIICTTTTLWRSVGALDVEIQSYECSSKYPVTADIFLEGNDGSARGTFGKQIKIYGDRE
jgi:hypothetical protein